MTTDSRSGRRNMVSEKSTIKKRDREVCEVIRGVICGLRECMRKKMCVRERIAGEKWEKYEIMEVSGVEKEKQRKIKRVGKRVKERKRRVRKI